MNVPDALQIAVLDIQIGQRVATVFRDPPTLVVLDAKDGTPSASVATCGDADDVFFDAKRHRLYVSCGEGAVDVLEQEQDGYRRVDRIATSSGARTSLFVPELDLLFVAARAGFLGLGSEAAVLAFRPQPWEGR